MASLDIGTYYDYLQVMYDVFYSKGTRGLHYGFWEEDTTSAQESIINTDKFVSECLKIAENDVILDAGCGIGGTCVFIARSFPAKVMGITLSDKQVAKARLLADKAGLTNVSFSKQDFTHTNFKDSSFSKIFAIESVCYAEHNLDFLNEAFRLLKKGGTLVVSDGFLARDNLSKDEHEVLKKCLVGWGLPSLSTKEEFLRDLKKAGFKSIVYFDRFSLIRRTRDRIYHIGLFGYFFTWLLSNAGIMPGCIHKNTVACINQKRLFADKDNIATYGVFVAEKSCRGK